MLLYEHKTRSDGCVEEVSIGLLLAQKGLANCMDYEIATYEESESGESEDKTLEFQESELRFTSEDSDAESKNSSTVDLLEKILAPKVSFSHAKQQLLKPTEFTTRNSDQTTKNCDTVEKREDVGLGGASVNAKDGSSSSTPTSNSRDQEETPPQPVSSGHVTEVTSSRSAERNENSIESSV